jgi:hypothetical protein
MQPEAGDGDAEAVRADDAEQMGSRLIKHRLLKLRPKPCGDDDDRAGALLAERSDQFRNGAGRRGNHSELRRLGQAGNIRKTLLSADRIMVRVDKVDLALEAAGEHVSGQGAADRPFFGACADNCNRAWGKRVFEITDCHDRSRGYPHHPSPPGGLRTSAASGHLHRDSFTDRQKRAGSYCGSEHYLIDVLMGSPALIRTFCVWEPKVDNLVT